MIRRNALTEHYCGSQGEITALVCWKGLSGEQGVLLMVKVRHQHTQGVIDVKMLEKYYSLV